MYTLNTGYPLVSVSVRRKVTRGCLFIACRSVRQGLFLKINARLYLSGKKKKKWVSTCLCRCAKVIRPAGTAQPTARATMFSTTAAPTDPPDDSCPTPTTTVSSFLLPVRSPCCQGYRQHRVTSGQTNTVINQYPFYHSSYM